MKDTEGRKPLTLGRRKSDIHYINTYSDTGYITNKQTLEELLRAKIIEFRQQSTTQKSGYRSLHEYMADYFYTSLTINHMDEEKVNAFIASRVPSHTSLRNFVNGGSLSMKYLDSIAYVFSVKYIFANFGLDTFMDHVNVLQ